MVPTTLAAILALTPALLGQTPPTAEIGLFRANPAKKALPLRFTEHLLMPTVGISIGVQKSAIQQAGQAGGAKATRFAFSAKATLDGDDEVIVLREAKNTGALELQVMTLPSKSSSKKPKWVASSKDPVLGKLSGEAPLVAIGPGIFATEDGTVDHLFCLHRLADGSEFLDVLGLPVNKNAPLPVISLGITAFGTDVADFRSIAIATDDVSDDAADEILVARYSTTLGSRIDIAAPLASPGTSALTLIGEVDLPYPANEPIRSLTRIGEDVANVTSLLMVRSLTNGLSQLDQVIVRKLGSEFHADVYPITIANLAGGPLGVGFAVGLVRFAPPPPPPPEVFPQLAGNYEAYFTTSQLASAPGAEPYMGPGDTSITFGPIPGFSIQQTNAFVQIRYGQVLVASGHLTSIMKGTGFTWYQLITLTAPNFVISPTLSGSIVTFSAKVMDCWFTDNEGLPDTLDLAVTGQAIPAGSNAVPIVGMSLKKL